MIQTLSYVACSCLQVLSTDVAARCAADPCAAACGDARCGKRPGDRVRLLASKPKELKGSTVEASVNSGIAG
jgi:hypothetical protein